MEQLFLSAHQRQEVGKNKVKDLREAGYIPVVLYYKGEDPRNLKVSHHELIQLVHQHRIEGVVINLKIEGGASVEDCPCVVKEIQYHPVHEDIMHVDFNKISLTEVIRVNVPIVADGEPVGVKQEGGSLEHILWEVEVECLPIAIPEEIKLDVSALKMGDAVHVKDLPVPEGVVILADPEAVVLSVIEPMKEEAPAEAEEGAEVKQEPEVIKEKKEKAEGESEPAEKEE